jgi:hypothetical protein
MDRPERRRVGRSGEDHRTEALGEAAANDEERLVSRVTLLALAVMCGGCTKYVEYVPVQFVRDGAFIRLEKAPALATPAHIAAMTRVLNEYHEKY